MSTYDNLRRLSDFLWSGFGLREDWGRNSTRWPVSRCVRRVLTQPFRFQRASGWSTWSRIRARERLTRLIIGRVQRRSLEILRATDREPGIPKVGFHWLSWGWGIFFDSRRTSRRSPSTTDPVSSSHRLDWSSFWSRWLFRCCLMMPMYWREGLRPLSMDYLIPGTAASFARTLLQRDRYSSHFEHRIVRPLRWKRSVNALNWNRLRTLTVHRVNRRILLFVLMDQFSSIGEKCRTAKAIDLIEEENDWHWSEEEFTIVVEMISVLSGIFAKIVRARSTSPECEQALRAQVCVISLRNSSGIRS